MKRKSTTTDGLKEPLIMPDDNDKERSYSEVKTNNRKRKFKICCCLSLSVAVIIFISLVVVSAIFLHKFLLIDTRTSTVQVGGDVPVLLDEDGFNTYDIAAVDVTLVNETNSSAIIHIGQCIQPTTAILPLHQVTVFSNSSRHQAINYFSKQRPLYLLNGSVLIYNITAAETQALTDPECAGSIYLFDNYTAYLAFLSDDDNAIMNYYKSKCISSDLETWSVFEFNIEETTFIYAGIELNSNNYTIEADISVNLVRYNTSDFKAYNLSYNDTKTVHDCHQLDCLLPYKQCLFVTSPQTVDVTIKYHRQNQIYKVIAFAGFSFVILVVVVLAAVIVKIIRISNYQNYSRLAYNSKSAQNCTDTENSPPVVRSNVNSVNFSEFSSNSAHRHETTVRADSSVSHLNDSDTNSTSSGQPASPQNSTSQPAVVQSNSVNSSEFSSNSAHDYETTGQVHSLAVSNNDDHDTRQPDSQNHGNSSGLDLHATSCPIAMKRPRDDCYAYEDYIVINSYSSGYGSESDEQDLQQLLENSLTQISDKMVTLPQSQDNPINFHLSHPLDDILSKAESVFEVLTKLTLNSSGLIHHCSQYGATLIIPEGAVQQSATVWFGACLFSDKFKFEEDYVPVSPIVWVYIDQVLLKPLELHIPHHIDLSKMSETEIKEQLFLLTALDDNSMFSIFQKNSEFQVEIELNSQIAKIVSSHLCSNCIATSNRFYKIIPKRYYVVRAEKNEPQKKILEFIFLYQQHGCKKIVEKQSASEGFTLNRFVPVKFADNGCVHLSFDPPDVNGWIRTYADFQQESLSEEEIDYYKVMECTGGEVTEEQLQNLKLLEDTCSYPPRLTIQFTVNESMSTPDTPGMVKIKFHGITSSDCTVMLTRQNVVQPESTPQSLSSSPPSDIKAFFEATDPVFCHMLQIITACDFLKDKWYNFGVKLGLTTGVLNKIEVSSRSNAVRCLRMVLFHWRVNNNEESSEPIAKALGEMGLSSLAHELRDRFSSHMDQLSTGRSSCDKHHHSLTELPSTVLNAAPNVADLNELVGAKVEDRYHLFGAAVGLEDAYLKGLLRDYQTCQERFNQVFNKWKETDPESFTWGTVIRALRSNTIKANEVAEHVNEYLRQNM